MATWLKQSTAIEIKLGPFVDNADGFTAETGLTIAQADVRLAKNAGDWAQKNESTTMVHEENGWYRCLLDATDTNTLGLLIVAVNESGALPVWREFLVVPAAVYDGFLGTVTEPGQGSPPAATDFVTKIGYLYKAWRNRHTQTSTEFALYADDGTTKDQEAAVADNGTTFDRSEMTTGA